MKEKEKSTIKITFEDLKDKSITDYCRKLLKEGVDKNTRLEVYRDNKDHWDLAAKNIGEGAKLMNNGDSFIKYKPKRLKKPAGEF